MIPRSPVRSWPCRGSITPFLAAAAVALMWGAPASAQQSSQELDRLLYEQCRGGSGEDASHGHESRLSDHCIPLAEMPPRPRGLLELGEPFLGTGTLHKGIRIPGGAVWQPSFLAFGTIRSAAQGGSFGSAERELAELPVRLDLFGNLYLTPTERVLIGLRPLDRGGQFTGLTFRDASTAEPDPGEPGEGDTEETGFHSELNAVVSTLFFEGDFSELFPNLDPQDRRGLDIYFSVGRQPLGFQDGLLINEDIVDMVGLTRANMQLGTVVNTRVTGVYAWGQLNRHGTAANIASDGGSLIGLFSELDFRSTTLQVDAAYVSGDDQTGNGFYAGLGDTRRIAGSFNSTFRVLVSAPVGEETPFNSSGVLLHEQFSWTPHGNHNLWYIGAFAGLGQFRSAARGPSAGGPLGATGVLFAAPGIGRLGGLLGNNADNAVGGSVGHQMFFDHTRQQLLVEIGARASTQADAGGARSGVAGRYQIALAQRFVLVAELGGSYDFESALSDAVGRLELVLKL